MCRASETEIVPGGGAVAAALELGPEVEQLRLAVV
jgi:hypothetical protein